MNLILITLAILCLMGFKVKTGLAIMVLVSYGLHIIGRYLKFIGERIANEETPKTPFWTAAKESYDKYRVDK